MGHRLGGVLGAAVVVEACACEEGGRRDIRWRLWNWIWSSCKGIGSIRGWAVVRRVEGRRKV